MSAEAVRAYVTPEQYLELELESDIKHEYWDGVIVAMAGGKHPHEYIADNMHGEIYAALRGAQCRAFRGMSVHVPAYNRYYYPDLSVACEPRYTGIQGLDVLVNPIVVVEVLSSSTAEVDTTSKKDHYFSLTSLAAYIVISQNERRVEVFRRVDEHRFGPGEVMHGDEDVLSLPLLGIEIRLADIYRDVEFDRSAVPDSVRETALLPPEGLHGDGQTADQPPSHHSGADSQRVPGR